MSEQNGEQVLKKSFLEESRNGLDGWEAKIGLNKPTFENEADNYLSMGFDERNKLSPEQCAEASLTLNKFAMYITRTCQREEADIILLDGKINSTIADRIEQQATYHFDNKKMLAIKEDDAMTKLFMQKLAAQSKAKRLNYLSVKIERLADSFYHLGQTKQYRKQ